MSRPSQANVASIASEISAMSMSRMAARFMTGRNALARRFGVSADAVGRHAANHVSPSLRAATWVRTDGKRGHAVLIFD
jgi:hypothetical protein